MSSFPIAVNNAPPAFPGLPIVQTLTFLNQSALIPLTPMQPVADGWCVFRAVLTLIRPSVSGVGQVRSQLQCTFPGAPSITGGVSLAPTAIAGSTGGLTFGIWRVAKANPQSWMQYGTVLNGTGATLGGAVYRMDLIVQRIGA